MEDAGKTKTVGGQKRVYKGVRLTGWEKKRRKTAHQKNVRSRTVIIGAEIERWNAMKQVLNLENDEALAARLLTW